ncbi:MAG: LD-carboxypeptidase [Pseudoclavibacter sp.]
MSASLRRPRRLQTGDTVAFIAPSGPVPDQRIEEGRRIVESWGLRVVVGRHAGEQDPHYPYLAGSSDAARAADFEAAWCDPGIAAVLCMRGGYGTQRFVDLLDWERMRAATPKVLVGYSDITALHEAIAVRLGIATLYGPMPGTSNFAADVAAAEALRRLLFTPAAVTAVGKPDARALVPGRASGIAVGGCLALLAGDIGTPTMMRPAAGSIALLEDVGEDAYRIDGFITHLLRAGWFDGVCGIALGSWADCEPLEALLAERLGALGVPVAWELGFGHCREPITVPLGTEVTLDATAGVLQLDQPPLMDH